MLITLSYAKNQNNLLIIETIGRMTIRMDKHEKRKRLVSKIGFWILPQGRQAEAAG